MSEPTFSGPAPEPEAPSSGPNKRLLAIGGGLAAVVLGAGAYVLFFSGGGSSVPTGPVVTHHVTAGKAKPTPVSTAAAKPKPAAAVVPASFTGHLGRDPFHVLNPAPTATSSAAPGGASSPGATPTGTATATPVTTTPHTVQVVKVAADSSTVTVKIDGKTYTEKAGVVFATYFKVTYISNAMVRIAYGDVVLDFGDYKPVTVA